MPKSRTRSIVILYILVSSIVLVSSSMAIGQIGGLYTFDFLNLTSSARSTALAGYPIAISDKDVSQGFLNPALINTKMKHQLAVNHNFHLADITYGHVAYGLPFNPLNLSIMIGANYLNYGSFVRADRFGNRNGTFSGSDAAFFVGLSRKIDTRLTAGINIKFANSSYDTYGASGLGFDLGVHYHNPEKDANWAIVLKNVGVQFSKFNNIRESFPVDLQVGYAKKLEHLPFSFMVTAHKLQKWDLRSPNDDDSSIQFIGQISDEASGFSKTMDNLFRHLAFGGEFTIGKNEMLRLRLGYNHLRNKELSVSGFRSLSGFSFGFGIKVKKMRFDYGVGRFHLAGGMNHLSASFDLNALFEKL